MLKPRLHAETMKKRSSDWGCKDRDRQRTDESFFHPIHLKPVSYDPACVKLALFRPPEGIHNPQS